MRKNLLVTTALVAVLAVPAFAEDMIIEGVSNLTTDKASIIIGENINATGNNITVSNNENKKGGVGGAVYIHKQNGSLTLNGGTFKNNKSIYDGGAIGNYGKLTVDGTRFNGNRSQLTENDSQPIGGGAISLGTDSQTTIANAVFNGNETGYNGGAIGVRRTLQPNEIPTGNLVRGGNFLKISNTEFTANKALGTTQDLVDGRKEGGYGGAIANTFETAEIIGSAFSNNEAKNGGGAVYLTGFIQVDKSGNGGKPAGNGGVLNISASSFSNNKSYQGGAILSGTSAKKLNVANTEFVGNQAVYGGGAIWSGAETNITGGMFDGNKVTGTSYEGGDMADESSEGGAAIFVGGSSKTTVSGSIFRNNESGTVGGAIATRANSDGKKSSLIIENAKFENNSAAISGGAVNIASSKENVTLKGDNIFTGNTAAGAANDIHNIGTIIVAEGSSLTLDGGISGEGAANFEKDTTLNIKDTTVIANAVASEGTTLNVTLSKNTQKVDLAKIFAKNNGVVDNMKLNTENGLYKFATEDEVLYAVTQKSSSEVAKGLGVNDTAAAAVLAAVSSSDTANTTFNSVAKILNEAAQAGNAFVASEAEKLGADAAPVVRMVETMRNNMLFAAVNDELNGANNAMTRNKIADSLFHKVKVWIRGLFNNADYDSSSKARGFEANTYGVAMGIDKEYNNYIKAGIGYAYSQTDVKGDSRDTDVNTNTLFVYGRYKPADWYINTTVAYGWSDYDEKKSVLGYNANAKYNVETIGVEAVCGLEREFGGYGLNPEFGLRYIHIAQDGYTDALGSDVKSQKSDVLTAVAGAKVSKVYALNNGAILRPELKTVVTYDILADDNNAAVVLANGAGYRVNGKKLERLGVEVGAKVAAEVSENWEFAAGYELRLRKDYTDNTLMLNAKYAF